MAQTIGLPALTRSLRTFVAASIVFLSGAAIAAEPASTHHFSIARPSDPILVEAPVQFEITARLPNNKLNKKAKHSLLIQITSGQAARPKTVSQMAEMKKGVARVALSFPDVGPAIVQVTCKADSDLTNTTSVSVLPQVSRRAANQ